MSSVSRPPGEEAGGKLTADNRQLTERHGPTDRRPQTKDHRLIQVKINRITLREIRLPLVDFFETCFGRTDVSGVMLFDILGGAEVGWGV